MSMEELPCNVVVKVNGVSKKFTRDLKTSLKYGLIDIFSELTLRKRKSSRLRNKEFWAVNDVGFSLKKGHSIGLVGANGSGKTTLLRMISGLIKVDTGTIKVRGRVVPLIALGAGFNQILTGRENIYVNLAILGLTKKEIDNTFDKVVDFAEIEDALDAPVQSYSSGMAARLGFACAVHANADLLLIDEVLSVGDMRFRSKCYRKLAELREKGTSFILVSHNTNAILSMCDQAVYLSKGKLIKIGNPYEVMNAFEEDMAASPLVSNFSKKVLNSTEQNLSIKNVELKSSGKVSDHLLSGSNGQVVVNVECQAPESNVILSTIIRELSGECETVLNLSSDNDNHFYDLDSGKSELVLEMPICGLAPGLYTAKIYIHRPPFFIFDAIESYIFRVKSSENWKHGLYFQPVNWDSHHNQSEAQNETT